MNSPLRHVRLCTGHTLRTYDTGRTTAGGKACLGYVFADKTGNRLFEGEDFGCSPRHVIDSDETLRSLLGFLTLRPGDIDREYFDDYTPEQVEFAQSSEREALQMIYTIEPEPATGEEPEPFEEIEGGAS